MTDTAAAPYGRFMAGYGSNLPCFSWLICAVNKAQWQVWQLFLKLTRREKREEEGRKKRKRIGITIGTTCHTCHRFYAFSLGTRLTAIATCHLTCHAAIIGKRGAR
jgi:hypothetical protein